jgi:hypothetical protein
MLHEIYIPVYIEREIWSRNHGFSMHAAAEAAAKKQKDNS